MSSFISLGESQRSVLILWMFLVECVFFLDIILHLVLDKKLYRIILSLSETLLTLILIQSFLYQMKMKSGFLLELPAAVVFLIDTVLTAAAVYEFVGSIKKRYQNIDLMSIKECMDQLPVGICFYWNGGLTKLVNLKMDSIARKLTGSNISDAESFWEKISSGETPYSIKGGDAPVVCFEDGSAFSFSLRKTELDNEPINELMACDITEEYRLTAELKEKQKKAGSINARLKALNSTIQYIIMDRETLQIKIQIHDSFGKTLLMTKQYLISPDKVDKQEMLLLWHRNISLLKNKESEKWQHPYFVTMQHAKSLGINVELNGELPVSDKLIPIVDSAITVHITNVLRHAEGDTAYISSEKIPEGYILRFTNNGRRPDADAKESGGLVNLRKSIESIGGSIQINFTPQFEMVLKMPEHIEEELKWHIEY